MNRTVGASAPGKIILLGEYAVLEGGPAIVFAVDRRARVCVSESPETASTIRSTEIRPEARFRFHTDGMTWMGHPSQGWQLARQILGVFSDDLCNRPSVEINLDTRELGLDGIKLGLGSSAALTVALCRAMERWLGSDVKPRMNMGLSDLVGLHRAFQGGFGSGADVAASLYGGTIAYRLAPEPVATALEPCSDLSFKYIWTGQSASTPKLLDALAEWRQHNVRVYQSFLQELKECAQIGVDAFSANNALFLESVSRYGDILTSLGSSAGVCILSDPHRRLRELADGFGVQYKSCGAGGGDMGVAISEDREALEAFVREATAKGYQPIDVRIDQEGVTTTLEQQQ